ncbi:MAG: GGDEF domain-containing protein [Pyrinomonadaceae bacterium]
MPSDNTRQTSRFSYLIVASSLAAVAMTVMLAMSDADLETKTRGFSAIVVVLIIVCLSLFLLNRKRPGDTYTLGISDDAADRSLAALDEAHEFFSGSLNNGDAFRLIVSKARELWPVASAVFYELDPTRTRLVQAQSTGAQTAADDTNRRHLAERCFLSAALESDEASAAIPLTRASQMFGVLQLYFDCDFQTDGLEPVLADAFGLRAGQLLLSSMAVERSKTNAMTDPITDLPNERAFYLVLESQIAETQRNPEERPLAILAIDIRDFDDHNQKLGHAEGDRLLSFAASVIKDNLRQMDFLARSTNDEFLVILPTATLAVAHEVTERIDAGLMAENAFDRSDARPCLDFNYGTAAFGVDGETCDQLVRAARVRKNQAKSAQNPNVLWFGKDLVG